MSPHVLRYDSDPMVFIYPDSRAGILPLIFHLLYKEGLRLSLLHLSTLHFFVEATVRVEILPLLVGAFGFIFFGTKLFIAYTINFHG